MCVLNQRTLHGTRSQNGRWARTEGVEVGIAILTVTPDDPLQDFVLPILSILDSAELEGLISQAGALPGNVAKVPLSYQGWLSLYLGLLRPGTRDDEGCPWWWCGGVMDLNQHEEGELSHKEFGEEELDLGHLLPFPCLTITDQEGYDYKELIHSSVRVWVTIPEKPPRLAEGSEGIQNGWRREPPSAVTALQSL